jgi:hypothetical protein
MVMRWWEEELKLKERKMKVRETPGNVKKPIDPRELSRE